MRRKRSLFIAAILLLLALLPVAAAVAVPSTADLQLRRAFNRPLAAVGVSLPSSPSTGRPSDLGAITAVGIGLLGLAAVVRRRTGT